MATLPSPSLAPFEIGLVLLSSCLDQALVSFLFLLLLLSTHSIPTPLPTLPFPAIQKRGWLLGQCFWPLFLSKSMPNLLPYLSMLLHRRFSSPNWPPALCQHVRGSSARLSLGALEQTSPQASIPLQNTSPVARSCLSGKGASSGCHNSSGRRIGGSRQMVGSRMQCRSLRKNNSIFYIIRSSQKLQISKSCLSHGGVCVPLCLSKGSSSWILGSSRYLSTGWLVVVFKRGASFLDL